MEKETANPQEYSANFKLRVILDVLNNGLSIHEAVRKYWDVTSHVDIDRYRKTVRTWRRLYEQKGANGFMKDSTPRKKVSQSNVPELTPTIKSSEYDLAALLAENEYLRMENMYLKKLRALILKEEQEKRARRKSSQN